MKGSAVRIRASALFGKPDGVLASSRRWPSSSAPSPFSSPTRGLDAARAQVARRVRRVVRTFAIGRTPDDAAVVDGELWVGESTTGTLEEIDPVSGATL